MSNILVVEDEVHLAQGLRFNLEAEGYAVTICGDGEAALQHLIEHAANVAAIVLDVMLPGIDGFAVAQALRANNNFTPILMLTALNRPEDVLRGFASGADDYLGKPFDLNILLARIRSLVRRHGWSSEAPVIAKSDSDEPSFEFDGMTVDFRALELRTTSGNLKLTLMEVELLRYLIRNQGTPVSRKQILKDVWNLPGDMDTRAIDNFVVRLRRYIEAEPSKPKHLLTVRGVGYKFVADSAHTKSDR